MLHRRIINYCFFVRAFSVWRACFTSCNLLSISNPSPYLVHLRLVLSYPLIYPQRVPSYPSVHPLLRLYNLLREALCTISQKSTLASVGSFRKSQFPVAIIAHDNALITWARGWNISIAVFETCVHSQSFPRRYRFSTSCSLDFNACICVW